MLDKQYALTFLNEGLRFPNKTGNDDTAKADEDDCLDMSGRSLNTSDMAAIALHLEQQQQYSNTGGIKKVLLGDCLIGDDGTVLLSASLKQNQVVEEVDLKGNNIRMDGCLALGSMLKLNSSIRVLSLEWNCIGLWERGLVGLAESLSLNRTLRSLDLRNNKVGPRGAQVLAQYLRLNTTLERLDLRWNHVGLHGGRALLDMFQHNRTVLVLEVTGNEVPETISAALAMACERNRQQHYSERVQRRLDELEKENQELKTRLKEG